MTTERVNRMSGVTFIAFSLVAALLVISAAAVAIVSGRSPQPAHDEGTAAHLFQVAVVIAAFSAFVFAGTANWHHPGQAARTLLAGALLVAAAFGVLYYFEHVLAQ